MKVFCLSSFPPKACGIAEFHQCLTTSICNIQPNIQLRSIAINEGDSYLENYPRDIEFQIRKNHLEDYQQAATLINQSDCDIVLFEHEFSLFGGYAGEYGKHLLELINKPTVLIAHTVPIGSDAHKPIQKKNFFLMANRLNQLKKIVVMIPKCKEWLVKQGISEDKIIAIDHGAPNIFAYPKIDVYERYTIPRSNSVVMTFGLIHKRKGIHLAVQAMNKVRDMKLPVTYILFAEPLRGSENESYLKDIRTYIEKNGLQSQVRLIETYLDNPTLYGLLQSVDIGLLPYQSRSYVSSGVLSYFLAAGRAIITTRFPYASYICKGGGAVFVPFQNEGEIATAIETLTVNKKLQEQKKAEALAIGQKIQWNIVTKQYLAVLTTL